MNEKAKIWFPFYVGDYLADTAHLTTEEHGAYLLILCHQWRQGHMDDGDLGRVVRLSPDAWSIAQARLKHLLSIDDAGRFFSARLDREKGEWTEKSAKARIKAKNAADARWNRVREDKAKQAKKDAPSIPPGNAQALPEECPSPSPSPGKDNPPSASLQGGSAAESAGDAAPDGKGEDTENKGVKALEGTRKPSGGVGATESSTAASNARPEPQPGTLHDHVRKHGTGRKAQPSDVRFSEFKRHLIKFAAAASGDPVDAVPWGLKEDRALVSRLTAEPNLGVAGLSIRLGHRLDAIRICLQHPRRRGNVGPRDSLVVVLDRLPLYADYPVDAFGERLQPVTLR